MAYDFKALLTRKNIIIALLGTAGVALCVFGIKIVLGDPTAASRQRYAEQKAGVTAQPSIVAATPEPVATPDTRNPDKILPPGQSTGGQDEETTTRPDMPGLVDGGSKATDLATSLPTASNNPPPPVPTSLLNQQLPNSNLPGPSSAQMPRVAIAPNRYLFNNLSPDAVSGKALLMGNNDPSANINRKTFSPVGESIVLATLSSASTRDSEIPIVAGVWTPFFFNGNKLLDVGDKLVGFAAKGKIQGRATVRFQKIIFKDGRSLSINALGTDPEGNLGIPGIKIGDVLLSSIGPVLLEVAGAVIQSFEQSATQVTTASTVLAGATGGLIGNQTQSATQEASQSAKNAGIEGASSALNKISDLLATDMEENKPYLLVLPGTPCKALLIDPVDISRASYGQ